MFTSSFAYYSCLSIPYITRAKEVNAIFIITIAFLAEVVDVCADCMKRTAPSQIRSSSSDENNFWWLCQCNACEKLAPGNFWSSLTPFPIFKYPKAILREEKSIKITYKCRYSLTIQYERTELCFWGSEVDMMLCTPLPNMVDDLPQKWRHCSSKIVQIGCRRWSMTLDDIVEDTFIGVLTHRIWFRWKQVVHVKN